MTILDRRAARVVLVDRADRTLLLRGGDPARPALRWWFTPGGGLNDGETPAEGAARELFEETGLRVEPESLGEPVWHQVTHFSYDNRQYRQEQDFYLVRVPEWQIDTAGFDAEEKSTIDAHRWWSAEELDATDETVFPEDMAALLRRCTAASPASDSTFTSGPVSGSGSPSPSGVAGGAHAAAADLGAAGVAEGGR